MDILMVVLKALGLSLGICIVVLYFASTGMLFWVRTMVRDKAYCYILSENKQLTGKLLKPELNAITIGSGADAPKYLIHSTKQFWSAWPPGFPKFVQEPVPTFLYAEGNAEPLDPYDRKSIISPEALRKISDDAMLKQMWKDVRETLGIKPVISGNLLLIILVVIAIAAGGFAAYMSLVTSGQVDEIIHMLGG